MVTARPNFRSVGRERPQDETDEAGEVEGAKEPRQHVRVIMEPLRRGEAQLKAGPLRRDGGKKYRRRNQPEIRRSGNALEAVAERMARSPGMPHRSTADV